MLLFEILLSFSMSAVILLKFKVSLFLINDFNSKYVIFLFAPSNAGSITWSILRFSLFTLNAELLNFNFKYFHQLFNNHMQFLQIFIFTELVVIMIIKKDQYF